MIDFYCQRCGKAYRLKPELAGRQAKCGSCNHTMTIPGGSVGKSQQPTAPGPFSPPEDAAVRSTQQPPAPMSTTVPVSQSVNNPSSALGSQGEYRLAPDPTPAPTTSGYPQQESIIELSLGFFPLAYFLWFCNPKVVINGHEYDLTWGNHRFQFPPGDYVIQIYFAYLGMEECGKNMVRLRLLPGTWRIVSYYMWPWIFAKGSISIT